MNKMIKPFNMVSALAIAICLIFPVVTLVLLVYGIINGFSESCIYGIPLGIVLSFFVAKPIVQELVSVKITLKDNSVEIRYFENLKTFNRDNKFKFPKYKTVEFKYAEITDYGVFNITELRKGGQDDQHRRIFTFSSNGVPIPIIMPKKFDDVRDMVVFNDCNGNSVVLDAKHFGKKQIFEVFTTIENRSGKAPLKNVGYGELPKGFGAVLIIALLCIGAAIGLNLPKLDALIVPSHGANYNSPLQILYTLGPMFASLGIGGLLICRFQKEQPQTITLDGAKKLFAGITIAGICATVIGFLLSVFVNV